MRGGRASQNRVKKIQKKFEKGIDKGGEMWYNSQAVRKKGSEWSLKIEQQEISTKHCKVRNTRSRQRELYILNKVKEAKKK